MSNVEQKCNFGHSGARLISIVMEISNNITLNSKILLKSTNIYTVILKGAVCNCRTDLVSARQSSSPGGAGNLARGLGGLPTCLRILFP